jgi:hypothetical protein
MKYKNLTFLGLTVTFIASGAFAENPVYNSCNSWYQTLTSMGDSGFITRKQLDERNSSYTFYQSVAQKIYSELNPRLSKIQSGYGNEIKMANKKTAGLYQDKNGMWTEENGNKSLENKLSRELTRGSLFSDGYDFCPEATQAWDTRTHGSLCVKPRSTMDVILGRYTSVSNVETLDEANVQFLLDSQGNPEPNICLQMKDMNVFSTPTVVDGSSIYSGGCLPFSKFSVDALTAKLWPWPTQPGESFDQVVKDEMAAQGCDATKTDMAKAATAHEKIQSEPVAAQSQEKKSLGSGKGNGD